MLLFPQGSGTTLKLFNASVGYSLLKTSAVKET